VRAHFEHRAAHSSCSLSAKYSGTGSLHLDAVPDKPDHTIRRQRYTRTRAYVNGEALAPLGVETELVNPATS
jgi:hypothetical protein